jgi:hypothetical protein
VQLNWQWRPQSFSAFQLHYFTSPGRICTFHKRSNFYINYTSPFNLQQYIGKVIEGGSYNSPSAWSLIKVMELIFSLTAFQHHAHPNQFEENSLKGRI